jgi:glycosyltransferase involved in cell wall biosynthesis
VDQAAASSIRRRSPKAVYAYEGIALQSFKEAKRQGAFCIYELPSAYWHYEIQLLREEAELKPEYADTILKLKDPIDHLLRKDEELSLADSIIVPSLHVARSLCGSPASTKILKVVPYGANESPTPLRALGRSSGQKLKILFVGGLTQRKGISYALEAIARLQGTVDLTLIGSRVGNCRPIEEALNIHRWIPTLPHHRVLEEMANHDVLLLPTLTEGFALVISEALSRGLPVITTRNSGAEEIIRDRSEGFVIPIRSAEAIADRIHFLDSNRDALEEMASAAKSRANCFGWSRYRSSLLAAIREMLQ